MAITLGEIADYLQARLQGDADCPIEAIATLEDAKPGTIAFFSNRRYLGQLKETRASAVIITDDSLDDCPVNALVMENPYLGYALTANLLYGDRQQDPGINPAAIIADSADIADNCFIDANVIIKDKSSLGNNVVLEAGTYIGRNVLVGANTRIAANVTICDGVKIGRDVIIHPGVVIGSDGFGIAENSDGSWVKIPQIGSVVVGDDVEIGANTTIDRGAIGDTHIGRGVKIDNQVQIAHNVIIGDFTAIAGCTGIAGSAKIGKRCRIGGGCGISGHLEIADDVILTGMTSVNNSINKSGVYSSPLSATDNRTWRKNVARFHRLDESFRKFKDELQDIKNTNR